jgi:hypothetical protein
LIALNATPQNGFDLLSLIAGPGTSADPTNPLANATQGFGSILTEMVGFDAAAPTPSSASLTVGAANPSAAIASLQPGTDLTAPAPAQSTNLSAAITQSINPQLPQTAIQQNPGQLLPASVQLQNPAAQQPLPGAAQNGQPQAADAQDGAGVPQAQDIEQQLEEELAQARQQLQTQLPGQKPQKSQKSQDTQDAQKPQDPQADQTGVMAFMPFVSVVVAASPMTGQKSGATQEVQSAQSQKTIDAAAASLTVPPPVAVSPEMQKAWADVKKFELTVQNETVARPIRTNGQVQPAPAADDPKQAIVTTDPMASIQLQQLPPRINAIEKVMSQTTPDRGKGETERQPADTTETANTSVSSATTPFSDTTPGAQPVEQARPAHTVEIPQMPHVQVVRTVSMEVGDPGSQVTVRIQERGGDISMQINAASEGLHHDLQSSVGSLAQALKQEQVPVSNIEVSRKSPIEKVRRMKEAH